MPGVAERPRRRREKILDASLVKCGRSMSICIVSIVENASECGVRMGMSSSLSIEPRLGRRGSLAPRELGRCTGFVAINLGLDISEGEIPPRGEDGFPLLLVGFELDLALGLADVLCRFASFCRSCGVRLFSLLRDGFGSSSKPCESSCLVVRVLVYMVCT